MPRSLLNALLISHQDVLRWATKGSAALLGRTDIGRLAVGSEADLALCSILSFWTNKTPRLIDSIFRKSGLYRPKWDEKHYSDGRTYGQETIARATELCKEVYTPLVTPDIKEIQDFLYKQERGDAELLASLFHQEFLYE